MKADRHLPPMLLVYVCHSCLALVALAVYLHFPEQPRLTLHPKRSTCNHKVEIERFVLRKLLGSQQLEVRERKVNCCVLTGCPCLLTQEWQQDIALKETSSSIGIIPTPRSNSLPVGCALKEGSPSRRADVPVPS